MTRSSQPVRPGRRAGRTSPPRFQPRLDVLEDRWLPSTILWNGNAGNGLWRTTGNWVGGVVPGSADDAVIDNTSPPVTVTVTAGSAVSVKSLMSTKNFVIAATVSFTVTTGASSVSAAFTVSPNATLIVDANNGTASFTATGTTTINGANLRAVNRGVLSLPGATSYDASGVLTFSPLIGAQR